MAKVLQFDFSAGGLLCSELAMKFSDLTLASSLKDSKVIWNIADWFHIERVIDKHPCSHFNTLFQCWILDYFTWLLAPFWLLTLSLFFLPLHQLLHARKKQQQKNPKWSRQKTAENKTFHDNIFFHKRINCWEQQQHYHWPPKLNALLKQTKLTPTAAMQ